MFRNLFEKVYKKAGNFIFETLKVLQRFYIIFPYLRADGINGRIENPGSTQWNAMEPKDLFNPRIFLCKSSRFLRNLNEQVDPNNENFGSGLPEKDSFVNDDFETTCDPRHLKPKEEDENENTNQDSDDDETSTDTTVRILLCYLLGIYKSEHCLNYGICSK